ncbi:MAG: L-asparaginase 1, partial [Muribaculaceae bacterium]|nr:L-asparaginase 1 [Muribaculaceae bacterium]
GIHYNPDALMSHRAKRPLQVRCKMDPKVMFVDLFPGIDEATLTHLLATPGIRGVVLKTYGAGNGPTKPWFIKAISEACERGLVILNVTQCVNGGVHSKRYAGANMLEEVGVVSGHDITSEAAITKLMYLFGVGLSAEEVKEYLIYPLAGEMTVL